MPSASRRPSWSCSLPGRLSSRFRTTTSWRALAGFRIPLAARRGRRLPLRPQRAARDRPRDGRPPDAGGVPAGHRARPPPDARGAGGPRDPLVHRLRAAAGASGFRTIRARRGGPRRELGGQLPRPPPGAILQAARGGRRRERRRSRCRGGHRRSQRGRRDRGPGRRGPPDIQEEDQDCGRRRGSRLRQGCGGLERRGIDPAVPAKRASSTADSRMVGSGGALGRAPQLRRAIRRIPGASSGTVSTVGASGVSLAARAMSKTRQSSPFALRQSAASQRPRAREPRVQPSSAAACRSHAPIPAPNRRCTFSMPEAWQAMHTELAVSS